jgi:hypothetical protein
MTPKAWPLFLLLASPAGAAFQSDLSSARSASLGNAATATERGAADLFESPGAIARSKTSETSFMYAKPFAGIEGTDFGVGTFSLAVPTQWGVVGAGVASFQAQGSLQETTYSAAYGVSLMNGRVRAGAALKRLDHKYSIGGDALAQNDPVFRTGTSRTAYDADVSLALTVAGPLDAGVTVRNVRRADVGLAGSDRLPRQVQSGLSCNLPSMGLTASGDLFFGAQADGSSSAFRPGLGLEKSFGGPTPFFLRAGANSDRYSTGLGLRRGPVSLDYAFLIPRALSASAGSTHQLQMTMRFGAGER